MKKENYKSYEESGIDWANEIPSGWQVSKLKWISKRFAGGTPDKSNDSYWENGTIPWLNSGKVNDWYITSPSTYITIEGYNNSSANWITKGALVMALAGQGKTKGMVAQLGIDATCNQSMAAIVPNERIEARFLLYWLYVNYSRIRNLAGGDLRDGLNLEMVGSINCLLPSIIEQQSIINFLDKEVSRIDTLIAKKQQFIERLKEKRLAVISNAVTKGIDPNAELKSCGVEWLGDIPKVWDVKKLKYLVNQINQKVEHDEDLPLPYIGLESIVPWKGELLTQEVSYVPEGVSNTFYKGCILFSKLRPYLAKACITTKKGLCSSELLVLEPLKEIVPEFLLSCLLSDGFIKDVNSSTFGSKMPRASWDYIGNIKMPILSKSEQIKIVDQINQETSKIDILTSKAEAAVNKLQEYKTALISAAVTGKIKVTDQV